MPVTIKDVARRAGVSPSTVSRVIAGSGVISRATRERVAAVLKEMRYHPNAVARSLIRREAGIVGLSISRPASDAFANAFFTEVIRGIGDEVGAAGLDLLLSMSATPQEEQEHCLRLLRSRRIDGVIVSTARVADDLLKTLDQEGFPAVVVGRPPAGTRMSWVNNDNVAAGRMATEHLVSLGHRHIGLISGAEELSFCRDRYRGYAMALSAAGLEPEPVAHVVHFTRQDGFDAARRLLRDRPRVSAVVAVDDTLATGALQAARALGRRVPEDLSLVGFNDDPFAASLDPPLTTVRIQVYDMGRQAARILLRLVAGTAKLLRYRSAAELVVRATTCPPGGPR